MSAVHPHRVAFGSCQERKLAPDHFAPDRLGNQMSRESIVGPGCYDNHEIGTIVYDLQKKPQSNKGFATAARFLPSKQTQTPSPQQYQQDKSQSAVVPPGRAPFGAIVPRFKSVSRTAVGTPGPGTYAHDVETNKKVSWPMCFGRPDWSRVAPLNSRSLQVKLNCDKEFLNYKSRLAYLSLYYEPMTERQPGQ